VAISPDYGVEFLEQVLYSSVEVTGMITQDQMVKALKVKDSLSRQQGLIANYLLTGLDLLRREREISERLAFLSSDQADTTDGSESRTLERDLSDFRQVIDLLGLRK
jgi:hypothetical protein